MPITRGAIRKERADKRKTKVNLRTKGEFRKAIWETRKKPTAKKLSAAYGALDRAAKKKTIHRNKAARLKSRLAKLMRKK